MLDKERTGVKFMGGRERVWNAGESTGKLGTQRWASMKLA